MWINPLVLLSKCQFSGDRGRRKAKYDIERNGYEIVAEELTMIVNKSRIRADFVARDKYGKYHVFEAKHGNSGLTKNQSKAGVYDMNSPAHRILPVVSAEEQLFHQRELKVNLKLLLEIKRK